MRSPLCIFLFTAVFNLISFVVYSFCSLSLCSFWAQKERKTPGTRVEQVTQGSCSCHCIDNTALSHPVRCKLRLHYARLYAGGIVDLQGKFVRRSFVACVCHFDNTALSHPVRHNLRLCYSRLIAGGIVDLQSKFVLVPQLELTRAVAQTVPDFFLILPFVGGLQP